MKIVDGLKVGTRLVGAFLLVACVMAVVAALGQYSLSRVANQTATLYADRTVPLGQVGRFRSAWQKMRGDAYRLMVFPKEIEALGSRLAVAAPLCPLFAGDTHAE